MKNASITSISTSTKSPLFTMIRSQDISYTMTTPSVFNSNNPSNSGDTTLAFNLTTEAIIGIAAASIIVVVCIFGSLMWLAGYKCSTKNKSLSQKEVPLTTIQAGTHPVEERPPSPIYEVINESYLKECRQIEFNENKAYIKCACQGTEPVYYNKSAIGNLDQSIYSTCN